MQLQCCLDCSIMVVRTAYAQALTHCLVCTQQQSRSLEYTQPCTYSSQLQHLDMPWSLYMHCDRMLTTVCWHSGSFLFMQLISCRT